MCLGCLLLVLMPLLAPVPPPTTRLADRSLFRGPAPVLLLLPCPSPQPACASSRTGLCHRLWISSVCSTADIKSTYLNGYGYGLKPEYLEYKTIQNLNSVKESLQEGIWCRRGSEKGVLHNRNVLMMPSVAGVTFGDAGDVKISPCSQRACNLMGESVLVQSLAYNQHSGLKRMAQNWLCQLQGVRVFYLNDFNVLKLKCLPL